jgi:hypothetical protein
LSSTNAITVFLRLGQELLASAFIGDPFWFKRSEADEPPFSPVTSQADSYGDVNIDQIEVPKAVARRIVIPVRDSRLEDLWTRF